MNVTVNQRFWSKVDKSAGEDECWLWLAAKNEGGYGRFSVASRRQAAAHRVAYELEVGLIPEGLYLDHLCRNRACVNPAHLEPITNRENILRGKSFSAVEARKTHCLNGHPLSGDNLYLRVGTRPGRVCRTCQREYQRKHYGEASAWERNPVSARARSTLGSAIERGAISRPDRCEACGKEGAVQGHHDDYTKQLEIRWLCSGCHGKEHRALRDSLGDG